MKLDRTALGLSLLPFLAVVTLAHDANAFSTGNHFVATDRALKRAGFDLEALRHVQAANYTVDHMSNLRDWTMTDDSVAQRTKNIAKYFHCDALHGTGLIERELAFIDKGLRKIAADAKPRRDARMILNALGIASHAIQDFYSHSNFADVDWFKWKGSRIVTFDDLPRDVWESPLITGRWADGSDVRRLLSGQSSSNVHFDPPESNYPTHGNVDKECTATTGQRTCGINHDGARRRNNLDAILMAAEATFDVVERMRSYVNDPSLWNQVMHPGAVTGVHAAWARAQAESAGAHQWGWESDSANKIQVVHAFLLFEASALITGLAGFDSAWEQVLTTMWTAAPTEHAVGGGAPAFPAANEPKFELVQPTPATATTGAPYVGGYNVLWGAQPAALDVVASAQRIDANFQVGGRLYKQVGLRIRPDKGLEIRLQATTGPSSVLTGALYLTGANRDLVGYVRDGMNGVPDGFAATRSKLGGISPAVKPSVKAQ